MKKKKKKRSEIASLASDFKHVLILFLDYIMKLLCETFFFLVMETTLKMFNNHTLLVVPRLLERSLCILGKYFVPLDRKPQGEIQHLSGTC